jgi:carbamoyl-phosphate synthase large subunit
MRETVDQLNDGSTHAGCEPAAAPTVLIPGAGGDAAIGAIRSLRRAGFPGRLVTSDADPMSPGFFLADAYGVLPTIKDPGFFAAALRLIEREAVQVVLPTSGFDTIVYAERRTELEQLGITVVVSPHDAVQTCIDKWRFYQAVNGRFPIPRTVLSAAEVESFPCFVKPIRGKGSRGVALCRSAEELAAQLAARDDLLIQEYLPGEEYSVDVLSDLDGRALVAVPRVRLATKVGISVRGRIVRDREIEATCLGLADYLGLRGPSCIQLRRDPEGTAKLLEVNPRMGGGTIFATLAGVNLAALTLDLVRGIPVTIPEPREITILRHYDEIVVPESDTPKGS